MAGDRYGLDELGEHGVPLRALLDAGVPVALGTDGVPCSMLWTMWEALARWDEDGQRRLGDSRLTREEALRLVTQTGHLLTWSEDRRGSIEVGKDADLTVLGDNPLTCPEHAIKDHNEIRAAVAEVARQAVGSEAWVAAVAAANKANSDHMAEEEREGLADLRDNGDVQLRHDLAVAFATFEALHFAGVRAVDKDPKRYVEAHR